MTLKLKVGKLGRGRVKILNIETEFGYKFRAHLKKNGWIQFGQYSKSMYDKGVDFDSYQFWKWFKFISMEWDNWDEWEIQGNEFQIFNELKNFARNSQLNIEFIFLIVKKIELPINVQL
jgi:hypothetical protein